MHTKNGANMWHKYFLYGCRYLHLIVLFYSSFVDITGNPEKSRLEVFAQANNSLAGNPFSVLSPDQTDSVDSDNASEEAESVFAIPPLDNHQFPELEQRYTRVAILYTLYIPVYLWEMLTSHKHAPESVVCC